jgi:KaiC/GvpD/RAD55 family RecA-like ATPase
MSTTRTLPSELVSGPGDNGSRPRADLDPHREAEERRATRISERVAHYRAHTWHGAKLAEIPPRAWIVPGWIPRSGSILVYGPPGSGKSYYALTLALELARGGSWCGVALPEPSTVLYLANERLGDLSERVEAWSSATGEPYPDRFAVLAPPSVPQLGGVVDQVALEEYVRELRSQIVILDTFARMTLGKDENQVRDMGEVMESIDAVRRATDGGLVIGVHHSGKDPSRGMRGSTAILGAIDLAIEITGGAQRVRARVVKSNAGKIPGDEHYELAGILLDALPDSHDRRSCAVLKPATFDGSRDALYLEMEREIIELLTDHYPEGASRRKLVEALSVEFGRELRDSTLGKRLTDLQRAEVVEQIGTGRATTWRLRAHHPRLDET